MINKLIPIFFIFSISGLLFMGSILITGHFGFALILSQYVFTLVILGIVFYILRLTKSDE